MAPLAPMTEVIACDVAAILAGEPSVVAEAVGVTLVTAETYIYADTRNLEASLWSFGEFVENNAWKWYTAEYDDVNRANLKE